MVTLEASPTFLCLDPADSQMLRRIASERSFSAGQDVFREGDDGDGIYVVKEGQVEITGLLAPNQRRVFAKVAPGEIFGEMAVLETKPRSATATASADSVVYYIPRDELLSLIERSPALSIQLLREISGRLRDFNRRHIEELLQAERLAIVGRFARSIVHDLKNPLNVISLTAEVSAMDTAPVALRQKSARAIRQQVEIINEMVSEILAFTQGAAPNLVLCALDFPEYVRHIAEELGRDVELRGSRLEVGSVPPIKLRFDPKRLRRVFHNLVHNATDAMPDGGTVTLRFSGEGSELTAEIEDTGPGIAPEIMGKLFEVFATHGKAHGTGLGLSICKRIVEDHRGRIWARNKPNGGAVFAFALPLDGNA